MTVKCNQPSRKQMILSDVVFPNVTFAVFERGQTPSCRLDHGFLHTESNASFGMLGQCQPPVSVLLLLAGLIKKTLCYRKRMQKVD